MVVPTYVRVCVVNNLLVAGQKVGEKDRIELQTFQGPPSSFPTSLSSRLVLIEKNGTLFFLAAEESKKLETDIHLIRVAK